MKSEEEEFDIDIVGFLNKHLPQNKQFPYEAEKDLVDMILSMNSVKEELSEKQAKLEMKEARDLLDIVKRDLKDCKILHDNNRYANSTHLLQQTVEKLVKAYCKAFHILHIKQFKQIQHKTPIAFVKMIEAKWVEPTVKVMSVHHEGLIKDPNVLENIIHKKESELAMIPAEAIEAYIKLCKNLDARFKEIEPQIIQGITMILDSVQEEYGDQIGENIKSLKDRFKLGFVTSFIILYLMSVITYPHTQYVRYHDREVKPEIYTEDLGIVKTAPQVWELLDIAIGYLERYLSEES